MVNSTDFTSIVARVECGKERGSGFFLADDLVATCRHCILPHLLTNFEIVVHFLGESISARISETDIPESLDTIFLRLSKSVENVPKLPLVASHLPRGLAWESFGFPGVRGESGALIRGSVVPFIQRGDMPRDVELECERFDLLSDFRGFSGSPVVINGSIRAMLQKRLDGGIGAISLARLQGYLAAAQVNFESNVEVESLPAPLAREVEATIPNSRSLCELEEGLGGVDDGYLLLTGHPGAGKTLLVASFRPATDRLLVLGRYFAGGYRGSDMPPAYYRQLSTFAKWLCNQASLRTSRAVAVRSEFTAAEFAESIVLNLREIGATITGDRRGVLLIDGVEAGQPDALPGFLEYLPSTPSEGLCIVLTSSDSSSLAQKAPHLRIAREIAARPLPTNDCEQAVRDLVDRPLRPSEVAKIAELSEGHPLTLTYYAKEYVAALHRGDPDPSSALVGGPSDYYRRVWNRYAEGSPTRYLLSLIASLRGDVAEEELVKMLPASQRAFFLSSFENIRYLFRIDRGSVRFYHDSFRGFIIEQSKSLSADIHETLAKYCESTTDSEYALTNFLYHHLRSSSDRALVSQRCTQEWLDRAAFLCVHPELLLADVEEILRDRLEAGDLHESIRLLLLRSRINYRYNNVLLRFASEFAKAALLLRGPDQALRFVVRHGYQVCSIDETLSLLRQLGLRGHVDQAKQVYRDLRTRFWAAYESDGIDFEGLISVMSASLIMVLMCRGDGASSFFEDMFIFNKILNHHLKSGDDDEASRRYMKALANGEVTSEYLWAEGFAVIRDGNGFEIAVALDTAARIATTDGFVESSGERPETPEPFRALDRAELCEALARSAPGFDPAVGDAEIVARALLRYSACFDDAWRIYRSRTLVARDMGLRAENGVDADLRAVREVIHANEIRGFTQERAAINWINLVARHPWERRLLDVMEWLGVECGRRYRLKALGIAAGSSFIEALRGGLRPLIELTLDERCNWDESYHLPEMIVPELFEHAAAAVVDIEPDSCEDFAGIILDECHPQLGVYTEGYTRLLTLVANALGACEQGILPAADIRRLMLQHLSARVFARQERVAGLLGCSQHLARLGARDDAERAFREAIESSLGPDWYKEDQFGLLTDALESVDDGDFLGEQWKKGMESLAYASGECTFQRYVRDFKADLIGLLSKRGHLAEAFQLYKHYLHPSFELQKSRMLRADVDKVTPLCGDRFGVLEVDEQRASLELLSGLKDAAPLKRWAIVELFWPWGDDRFASDFAAELCELLTSCASLEIGQRFLRMLRSEVSPDRRHELVAAIRQSDSDGVAAACLQEAVELGLVDLVSTDDDHRSSIIPNDGPPPRVPATNAVEEDEGGIFLPGTFGRPSALRALEANVDKARKRLNRGDVAGAREILREGIRFAQLGGWNVWERMGKGDEAIGMLLLDSGGIDVGISAIAELVMAEERVDYWRIAKTLMNTAMGRLDLTEKNRLFGLVQRHIACLLKPERQHVDVSSEISSLADYLEVLTPEECIERWIILLFDHPNYFMRARAAEMAAWLASESMLDIRLLVDRTLSEEIGDGREIATGIIHALARRNPGLRETISHLPNFESMIKNRHALVRIVAEDLIGANEVHGSTQAGDSKVADKSEQESNEDANAVTLLDLISGGPSVASKIADELIAPLSKEEMRELSDIRSRAFGQAGIRKEYAFEREATFRMLSDITESAIRRRILRSSSWNPRWPVLDRKTDWMRPIPAIMAKLDSGEFDGAFIIGGNTILHCFEVDPPDDTLSMKTVELIAIFVAAEYFNGNLDMDRLYEGGALFESAIPPVQRTILASAQKPAIARFAPEMRIGGYFTPALPSSFITESIGSEGFDRISWSDGRRWDLWGPGPELALGTSLIVDTSILSRIKDYDLVWVVIVNDALRYVVDPKRKRVFRGRCDD